MLVVFYSDSPAAEQTLTTFLPVKKLLLSMRL